MRNLFKQIFICFTLSIFTLLSFPLISDASNPSIPQNFTQQSQTIRSNQEFYINVDEKGKASIEIPSDTYSLNSNNRSFTTQQVKQSSVGFITDAAPDEGNKRIKVSSKVTKITGSVPSSILVVYNLKRADTRYGAMKQEASAFENMLLPVVGRTSQKTIDLTRTGYYKVEFTFSITYLTGEHPTAAVTENNTILLNRMARPFPATYTDPVSGKSVVEPPANFTKTSSPVKWTDTERKAFRNWYMTTYNVPNYSWTNIEIHHIKPREYGGTNDFSNLIPLPKAIHTLYTSWFAGY